MLWGNVNPSVLLKLSKLRVPPTICGNVNPSALVKLLKLRLPPIL